MVRVLVCAAAIVVLCSAARAEVVGHSVTYWSATDTLEIVWWQSELPGTGVTNIDLRAYRDTTRPQFQNHYDAFNTFRDHPSDYLIRGETWQYDHRIDIQGQYSPAAPNLSAVLQTVSDDRTEATWENLGNIDASFMVYAYDDFPSPPQKPPGMLRLFGLEPNAAIVVTIENPMGQLGIRGDDWLTSDVLWGRSHVDRRRAYFIPEPSSIALASLGVLGLLVHRFRQPRRRQPASRTT